MPKLAIIWLVISNRKMLLGLRVVVFAASKLIPGVVGDAVAVHVTAHHHDTRLA